MSDINYLRIAQLLGGTLKATMRPDFGGFSVAATMSDRLRVLDLGEGELKKIGQQQFAALAAAFEKVRRGYELDRVLVDPVLRDALLTECRSRGIDQPPRTIFKRLQSFRKARSIGVKLRPTTCRAGLDPDPFFYAAELAYVQLSYLTNVSVDDVGTDPDIGQLFDDLCFQIAPNGSSAEFRWAALCLRKMRTFSKTKVDRLLAIAPSRIEHKLAHSMPLSQFSLSSLPDDAGIFSLVEHNEAPEYLYVGSTDNLRIGLAPFRDAKPFRAIAEEYWEPNIEAIQINFGVVKGRWLGASPRDLSLRLIRDRHPLFNLPVEFERPEAA